jgi:hypothetical protein
MRRTEDRRLPRDALELSAEVQPEKGQTTRDLEWRRNATNEGPMPA